MTTIAVVSSGLREPSSTRLLADRLAAQVQRDWPDGNLRFEFVDLRHQGSALMDALLTGFSSESLQVVFDQVADADGLIAVTPAFNASFSGLFKIFFDVLPESSLVDMPVLMAATGGTERHSLVLEHALRPMFSYLHAVVSPTAIYAATSDFGGAGEALNVRIEKAAADFVRLLTSCGQRQRQAEHQSELDTMRGLLDGLGPGLSGPPGSRGPNGSRSTRDAVSAPLD